MASKIAGMVYAFKNCAVKCTLLTRSSSAGCEGKPIQVLSDHFAVKLRGFDSFSYQRRISVKSEDYKMARGKRVNRKVIEEFACASELYQTSSISSKKSGAFKVHKDDTIKCTLIARPRVACEGNPIRVISDCFAVKLRGVDSVFFQRTVSIKSGDYKMVQGRTTNQFIEKSTGTSELYKSARYVPRYHNERFSTKKRDKISDASIRSKKVVGPGYCPLMLLPTLFWTESAIAKLIEDLIKTKNRLNVSGNSRCDQNNFCSGVGIANKSRNFLQSSAPTRVYSTEAHSFELSESNRVAIFCGLPVRNTVTFSVKGSIQRVHGNYRWSVAHCRLWNAIHGMLLDLSKLYGHSKVIHTTAVLGSFYFCFHDGIDSVPLIIDAREGWTYAFKGEAGFFEFQHNKLPYITHPNHNWLPFEGDYDHIAPSGHSNLRLGIKAIRWAIKILAAYGRGEAVPLHQVQEACGILVHYACEGTKFNSVFDWNCRSILDDTLETIFHCCPQLSPTIRKWSKLSKGPLDAALLRLGYPDETFRVMLPKKLTKIVTMEDALNEINIFQFNALERPQPYSKARDWHWSPIDPGEGDPSINFYGRNERPYGGGAGGQPHILSRDFMKRWPYNPLVAAGRPDDRIINVQETAPLVKQAREEQKQERAARAQQFINRRKK